MKRFLFIAVAVVMVAGLILAGCAAPAPAPAPKPAPAPVPSTTAAPAPKTTAAPVPSPTAVAKPAPQQTWNLRFNHMNPPDAPYTLWGHTPWEQAVEKATNGRVQIQQYPSDTLMKSTVAPEGVKSGIADVAWLFTGYFPSQFDRLDTISLPFIADSGEIGSRALWALYNKLPETQDQLKDFKVLTLWTSSPYFLITTKKQVKTVDDIKGLKIRATGGPPTELTKLVGASPVAIPQSDVYINLQKGVIDGAWNPAEPILGFRFYELIKYYTYISTSNTIFGLIMNKEKWNEMPKDVQDQIMSVSGEKQAIIYGGGVFDRCLIEMKELIKKGGYEMVEYTPNADELAKWRDTVKPVNEAWLKGMTAKGFPAQKAYEETLAQVKQYSQEKPQWPTLTGK